MLRLGKINVGVHKNSQSNNALDELKNKSK